MTVSISAALHAHYQQNTTTLSYLVKLTRSDGQVLTVTDHDVDISYPVGSPGYIYKAALSVSASAFISTSMLNVDNMDIQGFLEATVGVSIADIAAGLWDYADVRVYQVNWADLSMGDRKIVRGWIGDISAGNNEFTHEVRSLSQKLQSRIGELIEETCGVDFFSTKCGIVRTEGVNQFSGTAVSTIISAQRRFTCAALAAHATDVFTNGYVVGTTGLNTGLSKEIKKQLTGGDFLLQEPLPYAIQVGDQFTIFKGCLKRYSDCTAYGNTPNFRGFPFLPGHQAVVRGPL